MHMDLEDRVRWCECNVCKRTRKERRMLRRLVIMLGVFVFALVVAVSFVVHASAAPSGKWRLHADVLARILVAEADGSEADWAAILWTLNHRLERYGDTPERTMLYSATVRSSLERPRKIHLVATDQQSSLRKNQLLSALGYVRLWINGGVMDPCPDALHWHGTSDSQPSWFEPITCGETRNTFGKVRKKL